MRRPLGDAGQAAVEVALVLPVLAVLALVLVQAALIVRDQVLVVHAAREAAREAAVTGDHGRVEEAARQAAALDADRLSVRVGPRGPVGTRVTVRVRYRAPTDLPVVGAVLGDVELRGAATMRVEG